MLEELELHSHVHGPCPNKCGLVCIWHYAQHTHDIIVILLTGNIIVQSHVSLALVHCIPFIAEPKARQVIAIRVVVPRLHTYKIMYIRPS